MGHRLVKWTENFMATPSIKCFNFLWASGIFVIVSHHRSVRSFTNQPVFTLTGRISYMFQAVHPVTCWRLLQECVWFAGLHQGGWQEVRPPPIWYKISRSNPSPPLSVTWLGAAALVVKTQKHRWVLFLSFDSYGGERAGHTPRTLLMFSAGG